MKKHTPGPWKVNEFYNGVQLAYDHENKKRTGGYGSDHNFICDLNDGEYHEYRDIEEQKANATLIAAAPELLDACKVADAQLVEMGVGLDVLRRAIEKAEGKS